MKKMGKINDGATDLKDIKCFVMDMDGTIYLGTSVIEGAKEMIETVRSQGKKVYFFTNNSSRSPMGYVKKLTDLGFKDIKREDIMTSGDVMINYLKKQKENPKVYLSGSPELEEQFKAAGIALLPEDCETADFAVLGFDTTFNFEKANALCRLISAGVSFLATNIDRVCPLEGSSYLIDCGSMSKAIEHATGVAPKFVGKPFKETVDYIIDYTGMKKEEIAMVGDRLYTDIKTAVNGGVNGIAVLSGEISYEDIENGDVKPDYILESVNDIYKAII